MELPILSKRKKVQTGNCIGTYKLGDIHPIHKDRFFYQYRNSGIEVWLKKESYNKAINSSRERNKKRMDFLRKNNPEYVIKNKGKPSQKIKNRINEKKRNLRRDPVLGNFIREKERNYFRNNPNARLANNIRTRIRDALKKFKKSSATEKLIGCTFEYLKEYLQAKFICGMSWDNYGKWHIDHIIPCKLFDLSIKENQEKCFHYTNLQPLWAIENLKKGTS